MERITVKAKVKARVKGKDIPMQKEKGVKAKAAALRGALLACCISCRPVRGVGSAGALGMHCP